MVKQEISSDLKELKNKLLENKAVIGTDRVLKKLRDKTLNKVFLASNVPQNVEEEISRYAKFTDTPVLKLNMDNEELGLFCKKSFMIVAIGTEE